METDNPTTTAAIHLDGSAIAELLKTGKSLGPIAKLPGLQPFILRPEGYHLEFIPEQKLLPLPDHIRQDVRLDDVDSFVAYVKGFRTHTTRIFASSPNLAEIINGSNGGAEFTALLDYHQGGDEKKAERVKHAARYPVPLSIEFKTWLAKNGEKMGQMEFVEFIEANKPDVVTPDSATLMELVLNFEDKKTVEFQSKIDRVTGGRDLKFVERSEGGARAGQFVVPEFLSLRLPIFEGGKVYELVARLEYRVRDGGLTVAYHLQRPHAVFREAHKELKNEISTALELEVLTGKAAPLASDVTNTSGAVT